MALRDEANTNVEDADCPLIHAVRSGVQSLRRLSIQGRGGEAISVDAHMVPVVGRDGVTHGATLLLHDASSQVTLEERVQTLHERATRDPLTQVANRAEFDRVHAQFVTTHIDRGRSCSLIICDLDHFKHINDTYGHQAGDEALVSFAALLRRSCRPGDLVARYGGEEFVMLCADCDNATATRRAEELRRELSQIQQPMLGGKIITASFGVTEIQPGDTPDTMLRRADRALLQAKDNGRNMVVQLGTGNHEDLEEPRSWFSWLQRSKPNQILRQQLVTSVPLALAAEKLKGFVADHHAEIVSFEENQVALKLDGGNVPMLRRGNDKSTTFFVGLSFRDLHQESTTQEFPAHERTLIDVVVSPRRARERRRKETLERSRQIMLSLKSYLMAHDFTGPIAEEPSPDLEF